VVWHEEFLSKQDLIRLYAGMDALVAPFRGEGFGMKIIDAMALGLPVLMPAFGGPLEFAAEGTFIPVAHREIPVGDCYDMQNTYLGEGAYWCEPDRDQLAAQLQGLLVGPGRLREIGGRARAHVRAAYSWKHAAERLRAAVGTWQSERLTVVAPRRGPSDLPLSVVIPTKDRNDALDKALGRYAAQSVAPARFELVLVNDHGPERAVEAAVHGHTKRLQVKLLHNRGPGGPAAARNLGIEEARGALVLITGDDIIPATDFLEKHLAAHARHPAESTAFVGRTPWDPALEQTPFMAHLAGDGGQQFNYRGARHLGVVPFDRFYTSNVSLKRSFLIEEETLFSTRFPLAAYEDIELAYRLNLRGMQLRFAEDAVGYHLHAMDPDSFFQRQVRVGRMLTLLSLVQPPYVPDEHTVFLRALEFARSSPALCAHVPHAAPVPADELADSLLRFYKEMLNAMPRMAEPTGRPIVDNEARMLGYWSGLGVGVVWDALNEMALRRGMAEEWARDEQEKAWARQWVTTMCLQSVFKGMGTDLNAVLRQGAPGLVQRVPGLHTVLRTWQRVRTAPVVGPSLTWFENSQLGRALRNFIFR
jgi:GT2 family glycosyltransferase